MARSPQRSSHTFYDRLLLYTWFLRIPQIALALAIFAVAITNARDFQSTSCSIPWNIELSVICAALSLIALPYLLLFAPPFTRYHLLPRPTWIPTLLDTTFLIFYLVCSYYVSSPAAACRDICNACGGMWEEIDGCTCHASYNGEVFVPVSRVKSALGAEGELGGRGMLGVPSGGDVGRYRRRRQMGALGWMGLAATTLFTFTALIFALRIVSALFEQDSRRGRRPARRKTLTPIEEDDEFEDSVELSKTTSEKTLVMTE
ncbi:MAG: hypothetical protein M1828_003082 [Chrysothrix sp. TS-e1954]|nr:MAG: hypothetical protein M1828_003082 [Chrysothrix sp. TS-e1954]